MSAKQRMVIVDGESLLKLFTHYYDGAIPLDAQLVWFGPNKLLQRSIGLGVRSAQWPKEALNVDGTTQVLYLEYEGNHIFKWTQDREEMKWSRDYETPKRQ